MRKFIIRAIALAMLCSSMISCTEETTEVISYDVQTTSQDMIAGSSAIFEASVNDMEVTWKSADAAIATVDAGVITAIKEGITTISAINVEEKFKQDFIITVKALPFYCIKTDAGKYSVTAGETCPVLIYKNDLVITSGITFKSTDESVFTITEGILTGVSKGSAYVEVSVGDQTTKAVVLVTEETPETVKSIQVSSNNVTLLKGATLKVSASAYPQNAVNANDGAWATADSDIVTISTDGLIKAISEGETRVTFSIGAISNFIIIKVGTTGLTNFNYGTFEAAYVLEAAKFATKDVKSIVPVINEGARVKYAVKSVTPECESIVVDAITGVVSSIEALKVGSYKVVITATGNKDNVTTVLEAEMTFKSNADLVISMEAGSYSGRRGDAFDVTNATKIVGTNNGYKLEGVNTVVMAGSWMPEKVEGSDEWLTVAGNVLTLNAKVLEATAEYGMHAFVTTAHEKGDENNIAINIPVKPETSNVSWSIRVNSYLESLDLFTSEYSSTKVTEKSIIKYYVNDIKTNTKSDFSLAAKCNSQCEAEISCISMINTDNNSEVTRNEFFKFVKKDMYGLWFVYTLSSNTEKEIADGNYVIKLKAIDSFDATKVDVMTTDLNVTVTTEKIDWTMLTVKDRIVSSTYTGAIVSNPNNDVVGMTVKLSDTKHFTLDADKNVVLKAGVEDGEYPLTLTVQDTRNFVGVEIQTLTLKVSVIAAS